MAYTKSDVDRWWEAGRAGPSPGRSALFVGAGISIASPTCLPAGAPLTRALVQHLLAPRAADEVLSTFAQCGPVIGRSLPRLEHVLDKTCNPLENEELNRPGNPRQLLNLFAGKTPNRNHYLIAEFLVRHKGWCITTNFDDCIERAAGFKVPVHVMDTKKNAVRVLNPECGSGWGIVKLHGTIGEGVNGLGATLAELQFGLPEAMRALLDVITDEIDLMIVAGYSGTDHFDVNHWIRDRSTTRSRPRLLWISHSDEMKASASFDDKLEPHASWARAFGGTHNPSGQTTNMLSRLLGIPEDVRQAPAPAQGQPEPLNLQAQLAQLYEPSATERYWSGARLAAAIGLGQLAEEELRRYRREIGAADAGNAIEPEIFRARGMTAEALHCARRIGSKAGRTQMLRQQRRPVAAVLGFFNASIAAHGIARSEAIEALACGLDIVDDLQRFSIFRSKMARSACSSLIEWLVDRAPGNAEKLSISLQGRLQTQQLRQWALLADDDENRPFLNRLSLLIHDQYSAPDFYVDSGPLVPGFFLIEQSTAREEDRLADLVMINLELARVLLVALRRRWPKGIEDVKCVQRGKTNQVEPEFIWGRTAVKVVFELLFAATQIATALGEQNLHVAIARCWLQVERMLGGVAYWKEQRLYLAARIEAQPEQVSVKHLRQI